MPLLLNSGSRPRLWRNRAFASRLRNHQPHAGWLRQRAYVQILRNFSTDYRLLTTGYFPKEHYEDAQGWDYYERGDGAYGDESAFVSLDCGDYEAGWAA